MRWLIFLWLLGTCAVRLLANGGIYLQTMDTGVGVSADQQAIIIYDADLHRETLALTTQYTGNPLDFAWIIPVPALPAREDVTTWPAGQQAFHDLRSLTDPKALLYSSGGMGCVCMPMAGDDAGGMTALTPPFDVVDRLIIDNLDIALLSATASSELITWLRENGYRFPTTARPALDHYIDAGWKFIAIKVNVPSAGDAGRTITGFFPENPLKISFTTEQPVFPMVISAASSADAGNEVLLYVFNQHRMAVAGYPTVDMNLDEVSTESASAFRESYARQFTTLLNQPAGHAFAVEYSSSFAQGSFTWGVDLLGADRQYNLTRLRSILLPGQMQRDVYLTATDTDTPLILIKYDSASLASKRGLQLALVIALACLVSAIFCIRAPRRIRWSVPLIILLALLFSMALW